MLAYVKSGNLRHVLIQAGTDMQGNGTMGLAMFPKIGASLKIEASTEDSN